MSGKDDIQKSKGIPVETAEELYQNAPCGYVSFSKDGTIFNINETFLSWLGFTKKEVVGIKKFNNLFKIGGKIFFETHFFPLIRIQGFIKEINFDIVRKDKTTFPGLINVNEISGVAEASKTYRATVFDITDRKIYENELLEAKKLAENASKAKAEFLSTISHEIRTPLNAILGIGNLIQKTPLTEQQQEYARILKLSSDSLLNLVNNLLDLSKIEAKKVRLEQKPFDLSEIIEVLVTTFEVKAREKNISLLTDFEEDLPKDLIGDQVKLNQVLTNLIGNAIKFTDSGHVKLKISTTEKEEEYAVLRFEIADTGIGIQEDKLDSIFSEFTQASYEVNLNYGGTGLGLTISQKLLQLYDSEMKVASKHGKGSKFSFDIKFRIDKTQTSKQALKKVTPHLFDSAKILIVDDNPVNIYIISEYLKGWNLDNEAAESGTEALNLIQENGYDLILMDLHMPRMDGYETSKAIRNLDLPRQPVIIALSASGRGDVNLKQRRAGINDYVPKPFRPEELYETLAHHLEASQSESGQIVPPEIEEEPETEEEKEKRATVKPSESKSALFDLTKFIKMANNQPEYLEKFITNTANAFEEYKKDFLKAIDENSPSQVGDLLHKSTMSIFYIQAHNISGLMEEFEELLSEKEQDTEQIDKKAREVTAQFDQLITGLRSVNTRELLEIGE